MRVYRKIIVFTAIFGGILLVAAAVLGRVFEDELTQYVVSGLNRQIRVEVKVEDVKLSFLRKFPDASLEFRDVFIESATGTDTLLVAKQIFLRFNALKLLKHQFLIREVQIRTGKLNIYIDPDGNGNYVFWEKRKGDGEKSFILELDNVNLTDILLRFDNRALEIGMEVLVRKCYFKGRFSSEAYNMSAGLEGMLEHYSNKGTVFLKHQGISLNASMKIDPQSIRIAEGNLTLAGQKLLVSGKILRPKPLQLDLVVEGKQLNLKNILRYLVISNDKFPGDLRAGGSLDFMGQVKGIVSNTKMPGIEARFSLQDGWLQSSVLPHEIRDIRTKGSYSNGVRHDLQSTLIQLNNTSIRFGNSRLGGDYSVYNLIRPDFNYQIKAELDLADIQAFIEGDSIIESMQGKVFAELRMQGNKALLSDLSKKDFLDYNYLANIRLENVYLQFHSIPFHFRDFSGEAVFTDHLNIKSLSGILDENQVSISGRVDNLPELIFSSGANLWMDIDLYSENLDINHLRAVNSKIDKSDEQDTIVLPDRLYLKTRFWFDELLIKDFKARQVTGDLIYRPGRLSINKLELLSMHGRVVSEAILEQQQDKHFFVKSMSRISSVNITEVFSSFNNFGQEFISDRQLKGSLSGMVNFSASLNADMSIKKESILADCDVLIIDGELYDFEPMMKLSRFIDVEELENVRFSTLCNEIYIRNEEVLIPKMDINSSAFDITASGIHGFDRNFTYKVKVSLSELLAKKHRKKAEKNSEFGIIQDDGLGRAYAYLIIEGDQEGTDIRYDRKGAVQNIRDQMKEEKQELKKILNEEFGLYKNDPGIVSDSTQEDAPAFIIEWEEDNDSLSAGDNKPGNISDKERFIIVWDDEEEPEEPDVENKKKRRKRKK